MCSISGIVYSQWDQNHAIEAVKRMVALQRHRGPDGEGYYHDEGVSLGHGRLAIIDLSETGKQPMSDLTGRYWITYNGEIYNYLELKAELQNLGNVFRGQSDTEVLLNAYCQWGDNCVNHLRGMFAFAIWDNERKCLLAARDRFGIKPFHYWTDGNNCLAFASELKALLEFIPNRVANLELANQFIAWNLLEHVSDQTMIKDIKKLPPAHILVWQCGSSIRIRPYWNVEFTDQLSTSPKKQHSLVIEFRELFEECLTQHLRSDVAVGTCLSGGLDSSSIVCLSNNLVKRQGKWSEGWQHSFSACFEEPALDERSYIKSVIDTTGVVPHFVFPNGEDLLDELGTWLWHQEEPVGGTGSYAQYCVARLARDNGVKVLLDGQGADEQLAGYRKFIFVYIWQLVREHLYMQAAREASAFFTSPEIIRTSRLVDGRRYFLRAPNEGQLLWPDNKQPERPAGLSLGSSLGQRLENDMALFSLPVLLRYEDRNTMAFGIEARVPFLDHNFVEFIAKLPADMRIRSGWTKYILRQGLNDVLPEKIRNRKSKLGFLTPEVKWLIGPLRNWLIESLDSTDFVGEVVDLKGVQHLLSLFKARNYSPNLLSILFRLAIYENWAKGFLSANVRCA